MAIYCSSSGLCFCGTSSLTGPSTVLLFVLGNELLCGDCAPVVESGGVGAAEELVGAVAVETEALKTIFSIYIHVARVSKSIKSGWRRERFTYRGDLLAVRILLQSEQLRSDALDKLLTIRSLHLAKKFLCLSCQRKKTWGSW